MMARLRTIGPIEDFQQMFALISSLPFILQFEYEVGF